MKTSSLSFELPEDLIAQYPPEQRGTARLMVVQRGGAGIRHARVTDLPGILSPDSLVIVNNSKVRRARVYADTAGGGTVEFLLVSAVEPTLWKVVSSRGRKQRPGKTYRFPGGVEAVMERSDPPYHQLRFSRPIDDAYLDAHGHVPLPPYIKRHDEQVDSSRYQTVYAEPVGSIAAPTAGLHLTDAMLGELRSRGVEIRAVTLHVGIGTFLPIRSDTVEAHEMHEESYTIGADTAAAVTAAKRDGRPVVAVGTTSVRTLESAWEGTDARDGGRLAAGSKATGLFITPGYRFRVVDRMFTNFHTPGSTLLALVCAFAGYETTMKAYRTAVENRYRFFSYGDAMLIQ